MPPFQEMHFLRAVGGGGDARGDLRPRRLPSGNYATIEATVEAAAATDNATTAAALRHPANVVDRAHSDYGSSLRISPISPYSYRKMMETHSRAQQQEQQGGAGEQEEPFPAAPSSSAMLNSPIYATIPGESIQPPA